MCGIAGIWNLNDGMPAVEVVLPPMLKVLSHRGPNHSGAWIQESMGLGQTLLAICDVSPFSYQPMVSDDKRYVLVFNGEIYNYRALAKELQSAGVHFEVHNDTQVLLHACIQWGVEKTLPKLNGMFAFALYDTQEKQLVVARDRLGEKPLYYAYEENRFFAFASELKALRTLPQFDDALDENALQLFLRTFYVPCPYSINKGAHKLFPGHYLTLKDGVLTERSYYDLESELEHRTYLKASAASIVDQLDDLLNQSVKERMCADVPVGAFLSGGIDSSLVVSLMQRHASKPVKTFSVGYKNARFDESPYAEAIARHLKTDHTTLFLPPTDLLEVIHSITHIYDEPFADPAALPTYIMSKLAKQSVSVVLTGDGGDELFAGYPEYKRLATLFRLKPLFPEGVLSFLQQFNRRILRPIAPKFARRNLRALNILQMHDLLEGYMHVKEGWVLDSPLQNTWYRLPNTALTVAEQVMFLDLRTRFTDAYLCKVDRAAMAASLEARAPIIDYGIVDFALSIPFHQKLLHGTKKYLLKQVLNRYVPRALWDRPKCGFQMPLADLFRTSLKPTMERYLAADTPVWKYLDRSTVQAFWQQHLSGRITHEIVLWNFFVAQQFLLKE